MKNNVIDLFGKKPIPANGEFWTLDKIQESVARAETASEVTLPAGQFRELLVKILNYEAVKSALELWIGAYETVWETEHDYPMTRENSPMWFCAQDALEFTREFTQ